MAQPDPRRSVPRMDAVLSDPRLGEALERLGRPAVRELAGVVLQEVRESALVADRVVETVLRRLPGAATSLRAVLNATGVVLHTNLGRAPLSDAAAGAVAVAGGYVDVEYDLASGRRSARGQETLAALRRAVPESGDVLVVNNGAAALLLAALVLAGGRELVVSRGELVEIGDGFRLPDLIGSAGVRLREVGTTNRSRAADYAEALGENTGGILKVHPSNFRIEGFTRGVGVGELAALAAPVRVPVLVDVGSGLLRPWPVLPEEPDVATALRAGASVVTCSGDKLLGGPQAGLLFGDAELLGRIRRHPMYRALRVDKLTLAALEATVAGPPPPATRYLLADPEQMRLRCEAIAAELAGPVPDVRVVPSAGAVGGGGAPGLELPGWAVSLPPGYAEALRAGSPPVVGRLQHGRCLLDPRCVPPDDDHRLVAAVRAAVEGQADEGQADEGQADGRACT